MHGKRPWKDKISARPTRTGRDEVVRATATDASLRGKLEIDLTLPLGGSEEQTGRVTRCSESLLLKLHVNRPWNVYHSTTCFSPAMQSMGKRGSEQIELKPIGSMLTRWIQRATSLLEAPVECE
jgi:hypothetical protein